MGNSDGLKWIEIFKAGRHTSSNGLERSYPASELKEVVEGYDPEQFKAPLIVTYPAHNTAGYSDAELYKSQLAYGYPDRLKLAGDRLMAGFSKLSGQVKDWIGSGQILGFSSSFYLPNSPYNPNPGKLSLRHIAGCGVDPPAVKGMATPELAEPLSAFAHYSDQQDGAVEFSLEIGEAELADVRLGAQLYQALRAVDHSLAEFGGSYGYYNVAGLVKALFQRLRDREIEESGLEEANERFPLYEIEMLSGIDQTPGPTWEEFKELKMRLTALEELCGQKTYFQEEDMPVSEADFNALRAENGTLREQVAGLLAARERDQVAAFVEERIRNQQLRSTEKEQEIRFILSLDNTHSANYGEQGELTPRQAYLNKLEAARPLWNNSRLPIGPQDGPEFSEEGADFSLPPGYSADPETMAQYRKITAYQAEKGVSFAEAAAALGSAARR